MCNVGVKGLRIFGIFLGYAAVGLGDGVHLRLADTLDQVAGVSVEVAPPLRSVHVQRRAPEVHPGALLTRAVMYLRGRL